MSGDTFDGYNWVGEGALGILWVEAGDAVKHPTMLREALTTNNHPRNVNSAAVEKPCL